MSSKRNWFLTLFLALFFLSGALLCQRHMIRRFYLEPEKYRDSLYVPSTGYLEAVTLGYDQFFADFFWLRMIQTFAAGWTREGNAEQMYSYFSGISDLDPLFLDVYSFAMMGVGEEGRRDDMVEALILKSVVKAPGNSKVPSEGAAYFGLTNQKNNELAKYYTRLALISPDHPIYLENWVGYFDMKQGEYLVAFEKYLIDYIQALERGKDDFTHARKVHLLRAVDQWYRAEIASRATDWSERTGEVPTLQQLLDAGTFKGVTLPNWHRIRILLESLENADEIGSRNSQQEIRDTIQQFIGTWDGLPSEGPYDSLVPGYSGYAIWETPNGKVPFEVLPVIEVLRKYSYTYMNYDLFLDQYKATHDGQCPTEIGEIMPEWKTRQDPLGGQILIDPETCELTFTRCPEIRQLAIPTL
jgi:hypothetical protein